jgi:hypothetical protein
MRSCARVPLTNSAGKFCEQHHVLVAVVTLYSASADKAPLCEDAHGSLLQLRCADTKLELSKSTKEP